MLIKLAAFKRHGNVASTYDVHETRQSVICKTRIVGISEYSHKPRSLPKQELFFFGPVQTNASLQKAALSTSFCDNERLLAFEVGSGKAHADFRLIRPDGQVRVQKYRWDTACSRSRVFGHCHKTALLEKKTHLRFLTTKKRKKRSEDLPTQCSGRVLLY